jgi:hypothetical protein
MAATARHRSPQHYCGLIPAGTGRKVEQPRSGWLRCHPARAVGGPARPLPDDHPAAALWWRILDQLPQTSNQDPAHPAAVPATRRDHEITRPAATDAALDAASRVRPEPLKRRRITTPAKCFAGLLPHLLLIRDGLLSCLAFIRYRATTFR